jgi:glutamine amidotransferase
VSPSVVVLDHGSGNVRSAVRMLERVGARVTLTADPDEVASADGLFVPGVGNFHACMAGMRAVDGPRLITDRLSAGRPVIGICVGMQVLFEGSTEPSAEPLPGLCQWPGTVERLAADVVPHTGWSPVEVPSGSVLFAGVEDQLFYFVHSYAARTWSAAAVPGPLSGPGPAHVTWCEHGTRFVAAVEDGPLVATQFHPEKSGDAGAALLENWLGLL